MKTLKEALIKRDRKYKYIERNVQPKTNEELKEIIKKTIEKEGSACDLNFIDTKLITDMSWLFTNSDFNGDISKWDVSNVKDMRYMFYNSKFNGDTSRWDVSSVKDISYMFYNSKFNGDISKWDVRKVWYHLHAFKRCPLENQSDKQPKFNN